VLLPWLADDLEILDFLRIQICVVILAAIAVVLLWNVWKMSVESGKIVDIFKDGAISEE
jgi:hypothetical protein